MGKLADAAKKNSNFLKIEKGETVIVSFVKARLIPSQQDPTKEVAQYCFDTEFGQKFWTNGNSKIMMFFDALKTGTKVSISRDKWINKTDGKEDTAKSTYVVVEVLEGTEAQIAEFKAAEVK
jgi:hypothetical protein